MHIYAFDPGNTTGFCHTQVKEDGTSFDVIECCEIQWEEALPRIGELFSQLPREITLVVEHFHLFPHKAKAQIGNTFPSVQIIGVIETYAYMMGITPDKIKYRSPGEIAKVAVETPHLPIVSGSPHKVDAYKHARLYYIKHFRNNPFSASDSRVSEEVSE